MRVFIITVMFLLIVLMPLSSFSGQESALTMSIGGDVKKPGQWSAEQVKEQFADQIKEVKFNDPLSSWKEKTGHGIPLLSVIKAAEPRLETVTKFHKDKMHYDMAFFVILKARDNFHAYFSLAELMPQFSPVEVYLVWDKDGKPLSGKDAPFRLVTLNSKMPDRQIYGISSITVVDGDRLSKQLKAK